MAEINPEYERGFKDGIKSEITEELKPMCSEVVKGIAKVIKSFPDFMIDNMEIKANLDGWIPCSERMPESFDTILLAILSKNGYGEPAYYVTIGGMKNGTGFESFTGDILECEKVTHWMPLPEPPSIRTCPMTTYPTDCTDECKDCDCGGAEK